jgi:hypothetical protein
MSKKKLWFKAKSYGWGWTPSSWEGWVVIALYIIITIWNFIRIDSLSHSLSDTFINFIPETLVLAVLLILIAYWKGEKPTWRWGNKNEND